MALYLIRETGNGLFYISYIIYLRNRVAPRLPYATE